MTLDVSKFCGNRKIAVTALTGSHNYNLNNERSDKDFKFFAYPTFEDLYDGNMFADSITSPEVDATAHDVRQLVNLVWKANINFIEVLFSVDTYVNSDVRWLFDNREKLARMNLWVFYKATYGMHSQKMSELYKGTSTTKDLVDKFGYDTKQACHAFRCLLSINRYMKTENMQETLWFDSDSMDRKNLLAIKNGEVSENNFLASVEIWKMTYKDKAEEWYKSKPVDQDLYCEAQDRLKWAVKRNISF